MSKKDFDQYFYSIEDMYLEIIEDLKDIEKDFQDQKVTEEQYFNILEGFRPDIDNYNNLLRLKYMLDYPAAIKKQKKKEKFKCQFSSKHRLASDDYIKELFKWMEQKQK